MTDWRVENGRWHVNFEIVARNQADGWLIEPALRFVGLDGKKYPVKWAEPPRVIQGGTALDYAVRMPEAARGRKLTAIVEATSSADLPIRADEAAVEVVVAKIHPTVAEGEASRA